MDRREFLKLSGLAASGSVLLPTATYAVAIEPTWIEIRRLTLPIAGLPHSLNGLRLLQLSDIHRSHQVSASYVAEAIDLAQTLAPELIVLTGDFITHNARFFREVAQALRPLAALAPTFAVPGNHDYDHWYTWSKPGLPDGAERLGEQLARVGITLLRNESCQVAPRRGGGTLRLIGLDDLWSGKFDPSVAFAALDADPDPRIVLCHNPDGYRAVQHERFELMLCGHTHGGQIALPLLGVPYAPVEDRRFVAGLAQAGEHLVYTNRGLGWNRRVRLGVRPEITLLELARA